MLAPFTPSVALASAPRSARSLRSLRYLVDFGIKDELSKRGLSDLFFKIDTSDPFVQRLTVTDASLLTPAQLAHEAPIVVSENNFIMDMWMRVRLDMRYHDFHAYQELVRLKDGDPGFLLKGSTPSNPSPHSQPNQLFQGINLSTHHVSIADMPPTEASEESSLLESTFTEPLNVTAVDWLEIQNPSGAFTKSRPPLPGQRHPGLKVARKVVSLILSLAEWKGRDCLSNTPNDWHNAYLYGRRGFMYVCPWMQGFVMAVEEELSADIEKYGLAPVAWAWRLGHVKRRDDGRVVMLVFGVRGEQEAGY